MKCLNVVLPVLVLLTVPAFDVGAAAVDYFLQIPDVPGESTDSNHANWIELLSFSHGVTQATTHDTSASGGGIPQREHHGDLQVTKQLDKSTPLLLLKCLKGEPIPNLTIELVNTSTRDPYLKIELENVYITSYQTGGSSGDVVPTEQISLNYTKITWTYTRYSQDGSVAETVTRGWDRVNRQESTPPQ